MSLDSFKSRIADITKERDVRKEAKIKAETQKEEAEKRKQVCAEKITALGYTPETLREVVEEKKVTLEKGITQIETLLQNNPIPSANKEVVF